MSVEIYRRDNIFSMASLQNKIFVKGERYRDGFSHYTLLEQDGLEEDLMELLDKNMFPVNVKDLNNEEKQIVFKYLMEKTP